MTNEPDKARAFYTELFGWSVTPAPDARTPYFLLRQGERVIGGLRARPLGTSLPSGWLPCVSVEDVDAALVSTTASEGLVYMPADDVPGVGRFAIVADPEGAVLSLATLSAGDGEPVMPPPIGEFCWETLYTTDEEPALAFYASLFGFTLGASQMSPGSRVLSVGGEPVGDLEPVAAPNPSSWATYVHVRSLEETRKRALGLGANVILQEAAVPGLGKRAVIVDPTGATLSLFESVD